MLTAVCVVLSGLTFSSSFLLDTNSSFTALTSKEFDQLLDLIVDEKKSRYQLEHYIGVLENKYKELEVSVHNLTAKYKDCEQRVGLLDSKLKQINISVHNITTENKALSAQTKDSEQHIAILETEYKEINGSVKNLTLDNLALRVAGVKLMTSIHNLTTLLAKYNDQNVGFTVYSPDKSSGTTLLKFNSVLYNSGNGYNLTTGKFVCQVPGLYLFMATIIKTNGPREEASCYIGVNNANILRVLANSYNLHDVSPSGTNMLVKHLATGDVVSLNDCNGVSNMYTYSSFSGVLISPDMI